jgi:hypothetical protein
MPPIELKRRLEEIRARYELEPCLKDIYVEGSNDCSLLTWFFRKKGERDICVYQIDTIEIPETMFENLELDKGSSHDRVILLSEILNEHFKDKKLKVRCVADTDYDRYLHRCRKNQLLEYTDYTCTEMYLFNEVCISKVLNFILSSFPVSSLELLRNLSNILQKMFLMRLVNENLKWGMSWLDPKRYTSWNGKQIKFDHKNFIKNYLMKNGKLAQTDEFNDSIKGFQIQLHADVRHNIRGHDFTNLLFLTLKREGGRRFGFTDIHTFERVLLGFADFDDIKNQGLFLKLIIL